MNGTNISLQSFYASRTAQPGCNTGSLTLSDAQAHAWAQNQSVEYMKGVQLKPYIPETPVQKDTIRVIANGAGTHKDFTGANAMADAVSHAEELAHETRGSVFILRVVTIIKPERKVVREDITV